jgi:hypothetical protein
MFTIVAAFAFLIAVGFLLYLRVQAPQQQLSVTAIRARSFAEHVVAVFIAMLGSMPIAVLLSSPFLIFNRVVHNQTALDIFSQLIDRPYFPLQTVVAFSLGYTTANRLKRGIPALAWAFPLINSVIGVALVAQRTSVLQGRWTSLQQTLFNWGCDCSASLLQWQFVFPLITSVAFTVGVLLRQTFREDVPETSATPSTVQFSK